MRSIEMSVIDWIALVVVFVGALNWGLVGLAHFLTEAANWNIVNQIFGGTPGLEFGIYVLVGLAAVWTVYFGARLAGYRSPAPEMEPEVEPRV